MILRHLTSAFTALVLAGSAVAVATGPAQASDEQRLGKRSLAKVLAADGRGFDKFAGDFDILDNAVRAVLAADPDSPVAALADGKVKLTAFAPTDAAFRRLTTELTGKRYDSERRVFNKLAKAAGVETIEDVLLYHVVPGAPITYKQAKAADGAQLETALEETVKVRVRNGRVILVDKDTDDRNARVVKDLKNLNKANGQIAHGVDRVLRPIDLP